MYSVTVFVGIFRVGVSSSIRSSCVTVLSMTVSLTALIFFPNVIAFALSIFVVGLVGVGDLVVCVMTGLGGRVGGSVP